jgi:hypothetical protein
MLCAAEVELNAALSASQIRIILNRTGRCPCRSVLAGRQASSDGKL